MGILDDLAMGFGLKEKTQDYYDRTEQTLRRTQGDDRGDIYARQTASRRANAPNYSNPIGPLRPGDAPLRQSMFQRNDPRDRSSSTFRNPQAGTIQSFFGGGSRLGDQPMTPGRFLTNFIPGVGLFRGLQRASGNQPYTMNTQSGTGPGMTAAQISAKYGVSPQVAAARMQAAPAAQTGAPVPPVAVEPLLGYGFEEDKFGFDPQAPRATLDDLDIVLNPGYSQGADGQYVPSYDPFAASESTSAPSEAALDFDAWLSSDQGQAMANKGLPEKNLRSLHNIYLKLNSGKF